MFKTTTFKSGLLGLAFLIMPAFADYSVVNNFPNTPMLPATNGVWSYGYSLSLSSFGFVLDSTATTDYFNDSSGVVGYYTPLSGAGSQLPTVLKNTNSGSFEQAGVGPWSPNYLLLHPGSGDQYSVIQFTAPSNGTYVFSGEFIGIATAGTTTDTHILLNGSTSLFFKDINSSGPSSAQSFYIPETLTAGETLDFAVGYGTNGNYTSDSTGLLLNVTPEPMFYGVLGVGLAGLYLANRRRRA